MFEQSFAMDILYGFVRITNMIWRHTTIVTYHFWHFRSSRIVPACMRHHPHLSISDYYSKDTKNVHPSSQLSDDNNSYSHKHNCFDGHRHQQKYEVSIQTFWSIQMVLNPVSHSSGQYMIYRTRMQILMTHRVYFCTNIHCYATYSNFWKNKFPLNINGYYCKIGLRLTFWIGVTQGQ